MQPQYRRWLLIEYAHPADASLANPNLDASIAINVKRHLPHATRGNGECFLPSDRGFDFELPSTENPMPPLPQIMLEELGTDLSLEFPEFVITITQGIYGDAGDTPEWGDPPPKMTWQGGRPLTVPRTKSVTV